MQQLKFTLDNKLNENDVLCQSYNKIILSSPCRLYFHYLYHEECFVNDILDDDADKKN